MEPSKKEGPQFSIPISDWLLGIVSYMMINLAQVSPPRQQGPAVLGRVRSAVWEALLEINGKHSRSMYC
ncbi:hypothetical protein GOODEAATRI_017272 [Goodea atripinnis]|uniref:Uncharacterized protein n=1 Tax=Goodea atripinnis TaxID=208336 RepID=A0ABV0N263_9TELE